MRISKYACKISFNLENVFFNLLKRSLVKTSGDHEQCDTSSFVIKIKENYFDLSFLPLNLSD